MTVDPPAPTPDPTLVAQTNAANAADQNTAQSNVATGTSQLLQQFGQANAMTYAGLGPQVSTASGVATPTTASSDGTTVRQGSNFGGTTPTSGNFNFMGLFGDSGQVTGYSGGAPAYGGYVSGQTTDSADSIRGDGGDGGDGGEGE